MAYQHLAALYDTLMAESPYEEWLLWAKTFWEKHGQPESVIDLGCGTGRISIALAKQGYKVTGVDLSPEMLAIAYDQMKQAQTDVTWIEQDMRELQLPPADAVISFCDSLSYLLEEEDVKETFRNVFNHLKPGGYFLFDVHSPYKILHFFGDNTFTLVEDEVSYIWQCFCDPKRIEVEHQLTFFQREQNGLYQRVEEEHWQRAYQPIHMIKWLREAGFVDVTLTADFRNQPPHEESERLFYTARRPV